MPSLRNEGVTGGVAGAIDSNTKDSGVGLKGGQRDPLETGLG